LIREYAKRILAVVVIAVLILSPMMLLIDVERFAPVVMLVWLLSAAYFVFVKLKT
jgi:hypothetical protein